MTGFKAYGTKSRTTDAGSLRLSLDLCCSAEGGLAALTLAQPLGEAGFTARRPEVERFRDVVDP